MKNYVVGDKVLVKVVLGEHEVWKRGEVTEVPEWACTEYKVTLESGQVVEAPWLDLIRQVQSSK